MTSRYSNEEKYNCAKRELAQRKHVYPPRVAVRKMTQQQADHEIRVMQEIMEDYDRLAKADRLL